MAATLKIDELIRRIMERGEVALQRIDELLDGDGEPEDPDRFEDEFSGATQQPEVEDEAEGVRP